MKRIFTILICMSMIIGTHATTIVAHRGGANLAPENTLQCFRMGIEHHADLIEIDIHLSKDGEIIVCHDETVERTTNGKGKIRDLTAAEIAALRIVHKGEQTDLHMPTLDEVFQLLQTYRQKGYNVGLLIEIKRSKEYIYPQLEEKLLQKIALYQAENWVIVQSFNDEALDRIHVLNPNIRLEKLLLFMQSSLAFLVDGVRLSKFTYERYAHVQSFNFFHSLLSQDLVNQLHAHGKEVKIWTVNRVEDVKVTTDGIITNSPDLFTGK